MHRSQLSIPIFGRPPAHLYAFIDDCNGLKASSPAAKKASSGEKGSEDKIPKKKKKGRKGKGKGKGKNQYNSSNKQSPTVPNHDTTNEHRSAPPATTSPDEANPTQLPDQAGAEQDSGPSVTALFVGTGLSKKRRRSIAEQALTPPESDYQIQRGVARKKQKVQHESNATPPDIEPQNQNPPSKKRRRSIEGRVAISPTPSIGPDHESGSKRQKLATGREETPTNNKVTLQEAAGPKDNEQSLTPPADKELSKSELKRITNQRRLKSNALVADADVLILARVDIYIVYSPHTPKDPPPANPKFQFERGFPVHLKKFTQLPDGKFIGCIQCIENDSLFEFAGSSDCPESALEVLRQVIKVAANAKDKPLASNCWFSKTPCTAEDKGHEEWRLRCQILAKPAKSLIQNLPINPEPSLFEKYAFNEPPATFEPWSPKDFYENVCIPEVDGLEDKNLQEVKCKLYPFQRRAVTWLLQREGVEFADNEVEVQQTRNYGQTLPHGFKPTPDVDGKEWLVSRCLGLPTKDRNLAKDYASQIKGGILAEEMGLGKTVEMIALMCLHKRGATKSRQDVNQYGEPLKQSPATLIITPPAILRQWESELRTLAPNLKVMIYEGVRTERKGGVENDELVDRLAEHDVVLTTYNVLGREVHYTAGAVIPRNLRYERIYERKKSPLTQIMWWRVVLDEAQMVDTGVSNAAKVAQIIHRENAWAVSGTPVRKESNDLLGLLIFLRFKPYCDSVKLWMRMIKHYRGIFSQIFRSIALRHTKDQVRNELQLPPQTRVVINIPFTPMEDMHYSKMFQDMCKACGVDLNGWPLEADWDPNSPAVVAKMREWLTRLRQDCLHPDIGIKNRKALGAIKQPLRTIYEVYDVMAELNETNRRAEERALLVARLRRGQVLEHAKQSHQALRIWKDVLAEARLIVETDRDQLKSEMAQLGLKEDLDVQDGDTTPENEATTRLGAYRQRLRGALEVEHMSCFFVANAYFQIKSDTSQTEPESDAYHELGTAEEENYELAKRLRQELLTEPQRKADTQMSRIKVKASNKDMVELPQIKQIEGRGGIESRDLLAKIIILISAVNTQSSQLVEWRQKLSELALLPLVDKDDSELQGDEYETSTKQQDELYVYMDALRIAVSDRRGYVTGHTNNRIEDEVKTAIRLAQAGEGHSPELMLKLLHMRESLKPSTQTGTVRGVVSGLRELKSTLQAPLGQGSVRAGTEMMIVNSALDKMIVVSSQQTNIQSSLERELEFFKNAVDSRLEYYRQLQHISDQVVPYEKNMDEAMLAATMTDMEQKESKSRERLATLTAHARFLNLRKTESIAPDADRECIICRETFERGVLTSCGHAYCSGCSQLWWNNSHKCPTCKKQLSKKDFHQITYKLRELTVQEETATTGKAVLENASQESIYSGINSAILNQIKNIDLYGSYGTKIDTMARHILWIREKDPGAKTVMFSQYKDFLKILGKAFDHFKITHASIDVLKGANDFKSDPSIECFFLHAKAQAGGLNLVNATHVILCEPLMNTAIELQAIARVHRIGQHQPTTVWMYLIEDTVEKAIYEISVNRRMAHLGHSVSEAKSSASPPELSENQLDAANTLEVQQARLGKVLKKGIDELVDQEDLWECLFRQRPEGIKQLAANAERSRPGNVQEPATQGQVQDADTGGT